MAANFYVLGIVGSGTEYITINEHTVCNDITNSSVTKAYFIPTKTASEWENFRTNAGANPDITVSLCCAKAC